MNSDTRKKNFSELKNKLRNKFPQLTEADLSSEEGDESSVMRMVEYKLHKSTDEMKEIISDL
jgi:hypothetical protein